jgi:hypothetical protein
MENFNKREVVDNLDDKVDINYHETSELIKSLQNHCSNINDESIKNSEALLNYLNNSLESFTTVQIANNSTGTKIINKFPSTELCDKVWNSIREKDFSKPDFKIEIVIPSSDSIHPESSGNYSCSQPKSIATNLNPTNDQVHVLQVLKSRFEEYKISITYAWWTRCR